MKAYAQLAALAVVSSLTYTNAHAQAQPSNPSQGACDAVLGGSASALCEKAHRANNKVESISSQMEEQAVPRKNLIKLLARSQQRLAKLELKFEQLTGYPVPGLSVIGCELPEVVNWESQTRTNLQENIDAGELDSEFYVRFDEPSVCVVSFAYSEAYQENFICAQEPFLTIQQSDQQVESYSSIRGQVTGSGYDFSTGEVSLTCGYSYDFDSVDPNYFSQEGFDLVDLEACAIALGCTNYANDVAE